MGEIILDDTKKINQRKTISHVDFDEGSRLLYREELEVEGYVVCSAMSALYSVRC